MAESGAPGTQDFEAVAWQSLVAPAGTPPELVRKYADALAKVMAQPDLRARLEADGFEPVARPHVARAAGRLHPQRDRPLGQGDPGVGRHASTEAPAGPVQGPPDGARRPII